MRRTIIVSLVAMLALAFAGCGGGGGSNGTDGLSLLLESSQAMMEVSGYRMEGTIEMEAEALSAGGQGQVISMDLRAEVQNADGETRQHMFIDLGGYEVEAYIIGGVYYQNLPGQGWMKTSAGAYMSQGMNLGVVGAEQMEMMARMAKDTEVEEESEGVMVVTYHLDQEYVQSAMGLYREYAEEQNEQISEEWLSMAEEAMSDFQAELRIWINAADKLIRRMEMSYTMSGMTETGKITSSLQADIFDYGVDIAIELPAEAAQAEEFEPTF